MEHILFVLLFVLNFYIFISLYLTKYIFFIFIVSIISAQKKNPKHYLLAIQTFSLKEHTKSQT
jgi:hypothetical protein